MKRKIIIVAMMPLVLMMVWSGCGSNSKSYVGMTSDNAMTNGGYDYSADESVETFYLKEDGSGSSETSTIQDNRKRIKYVDMEIETLQFDQVVEDIEEQVQRASGYIENMSSYNGRRLSQHSAGRKSATIIIRIPAENLDGFVDSLSDQTNVISRNIRVEDVTLTYMDTESRKQALEVEHQRLLELMEKAEDIDTILRLESRLSELRYEMQYLGSQLKSLDNKITYSTLTLNIYEVEIFTPVEQEGALSRMKNGIVDSFLDIVNAIREMVIGIVIYSPYIILWTIVAVILVIVVRVLDKQAKRRRKQKLELLAKQRQEQSSENK